MLREEPLDDWLMLTSMFDEIPPETSANYRNFIREGMDRLAALLDHNQTAPKKRDLSDARLSYPLFSGAGQLPPPDLERAQQLFWRVAQARGTGSVPTQQGLFSVIALSLNPSISVPFLVQILDFSQPRDTFAGKRDQLALAALALLAIRTGDAASYAALQQATQHANPDVRGMAAGYLGRAYLDAEQPLPAEVAELLRTVATSDPAFLPRYKARLNLGGAGMAVPLDYPEGAFLFKVKFQHAKRIYCTIAVRSTQTLHDLHLAIQRAIQWNNDHLYAFFLDRKHDNDPEMRVVGPWEYEQGTDTALPADRLRIGMPGFVRKHTFRYLFDYGDMHEFEIDVVGIEETAEPGDYPRVVTSQGKAPAQYG